MASLTIKERLFVIPGAFHSQFKTNYILISDCNSLPGGRKLDETCNQRQANKSMFPKVCTTEHEFHKMLWEKGSRALKSLGNNICYILSWKFIIYVIRMMLKSYTKEIFSFIWPISQTHLTMESICPFNSYWPHLGNAALNSLLLQVTITDLFRLPPTHTLAVPQGPDLSLLIRVRVPLEHKLSSSTRERNFILF